MKHFLDYLVFFTGGVLFLITLNIFQGEKSKTILTVASFVIFYIAWSVYHHSKEKTLHLKNVIEYLFVGLIILMLFLSFLKF